jgi:hypothetical protein
LGEAKANLIHLVGAIQERHVQTHSEHAKNNYQPEGSLQLLKIFAFNLLTLDFSRFRGVLDDLHFVDEIFLSNNNLTVSAFLSM